ncbi:MAG: DNA topoisomerase IV subunit A [Candidatus Pacebacteria bacterium]|nr:DNA topoisomerase IV subunit A [Candidatus Paceibacterota bacterium]
MSAAPPDLLNPTAPTDGEPLVDFADALGERYLSYALSTIMSRSLPDLRDGLKPVHRRLLFAMSELGLGPTTAPKKAAKVVGDVIGKFHPHGDQAVYETLVRLAQEFSLRYPLIDGHGNFGNIDGDNAAAMRYTEARLTAVGAMLLRGLDQDTVDFRPTYDNDGEEPVVLPAGFPNLLANGSSGIAVGMATSIPPHNVAELSLALLHLIKEPKASVGELLQFVAGPDFPTGGVLVESAAAIAQAYETGRGSFRLRAFWQVEKLPQGAWQIIVTEIPFQLAKSKIIEKIAELLEAKTLPLLADVRDESDELVRIVLEPRSRTVEPAVLMESLFRAGVLESRFPLNMNVLAADGAPQVLNLRAVLQGYLDHQREVLLRRSQHRLAAVAARLEILQGFLVIFLDLDRVIAIIRNEDEPKPIMMAEFKLNEIQVEAILNMRLRSLRKLEEMALQEEAAKLTTEQQALVKLLENPKAQWKAIENEIKALDKVFGPDTELGRRRTRIEGEAPTIEIPAEPTAPSEALTVILSTKGWIRSLRGQDNDLNEVKFKDGDSLFAAIRVDSRDRLLIFVSDGRFYTLAADKLPRGKGFGEPLRLFLEIPAEHQLIDIFIYQPESRFLLASNDGRGFIVQGEGLLAQTRNGRQVLTPAEGARAQFCLRLPESAASHVVAVGQNNMMLIFPLEQIPTLVKGQGVILQKYKNSALFKDGALVGLSVMTLAEGLKFPSGTAGKIKTVTELDKWLGNRAGMGSAIPTGYPKARV